MKEISPNDYIIFLTSAINGSSYNKLVFFAYSKVEYVYLDNSELYNYYKSKNKIKLRGVKYLGQPVPKNSIIKDLELFKDKKNPSSVLKSEYNEISKVDFHKIKNSNNIIKTFPSYLENLSFNLEEFIISSIQLVYNNIKLNTKTSQMEINKFIDLIYEVLKFYGVKKNRSYLKEFYSQNIWKLEYKHVPSRNPDKFVVLYNKSGRGANYGYISFE